MDTAIATRPAAQTSTSTIGPPPAFSRFNRPVLGSLPHTVSNPGPPRRTFETSPDYRVSPGHFSPAAGLGVTDQAVDYFTQHTAGRTSLRAPVNLGLVTSGRVTIALGLVGVYTGYDEAKWRMALGITGIVVGVALAGWGTWRFRADTMQFNHRLANLAASSSALGIVLSTAGGVLYTWAHLQDNRSALWGSTAVRTAGSILLFGAMPPGFSSTEIVWGDSPLTNRVVVRDAAYAHGAALLMAWAHLSTPSPPAPLWSREALQCLGIALLATGASLARTDMSRQEAMAQRQHQVRRDTLHAISAVHTPVGAGSRTHSPGHVGEAGAV